MKRRPAFSLVAALLPSVALACGGDDSAPGGGGDGAVSPSPNADGASGDERDVASADDGASPTDASGGPSSEQPGADVTLPLAGSGCAARDDDENFVVVAAEANNYGFTSTLSFPPAVVAPGRDLEFDWSGLSRDFLGQELDPLTDIDTVSLMLWRLTEQDLQTKLNADQLVQRDLAVIATAPTENATTSLSLFDFGTPGRGPEDPPFSAEEILPFLDADGYDPAENTYTLMVSTGTLLGAGTRMIQSFKLDPQTDNVDVAMADDSTVLDFSVDLQNLEHTPIPLDDPAISIDWSSMTENALGNEFSRNSIGLVAIAHYSAAPEDLEENFLDLIRYDRSIVADESWLLDVPAGESAVLGEAVDENGSAFPGVDGTGTWMLALFCAQCRNPAPWYLTFLTACSDG